MLYCLFWFRAGKREDMVLEIKLNLNNFLEAQDIKTPRQILENFLSAETNRYEYNDRNPRVARQSFTSHSGRFSLIYSMFEESTGLCQQS